jgi:hypothetical protein
VKQVYTNIVPLANSPAEGLAALEELCRTKVAEVLQAYLNAEADELIQRRRYERIEEGAPVLYRNGHVIQPTNLNLGNQDVTEIFEEAVYRRYLNCDFSLKSFDYVAPFTFVLANVDTRFQVGIEKDYDLDPSTFR